MSALSGTKCDEFDVPQRSSLNGYRDESIILPIKDATRLYTAVTMSIHDACRKWVPVFGTAFATIALMLLLAWVMPVLAGVFAEDTSAGMDEHRVAPADSRLVLSDDAAPADLWPHVRVFEDRSTRLGVHELNRDAFVAPETPRWSFGNLSSALWLHLPLEVSGGDGQWLLSIDYAALETVDVHVLEKGQEIGHHRIGAGMPVGQRPLASRIPAAELDFPAAGSYDLFIRVQSNSSLVIPIRLQKPVDFHLEQSAVGILQGALVGVALVLMLFSLAQWSNNGGVMFACYALKVVSFALFSLSHYGLLSQFLLSADALIDMKFSPVSVLLAIVAGCGFVSTSLNVRQTQPLANFGLIVLSLAATLIMCLALAGWIDYRSTFFMTALIGPLMPLLAVWSAIANMRAGDRAGAYMLVGWVLYSCGAITFALLIRGVLVPANYWTLHAVQFGVLLEMLMLLKVLIIRIDALRLEAENTAVEKEALLSMALTDSLTGLANRRGLMQELESALAGVTPDRRLALYFMDLDGFKAVNDREGHAAGDRLLVGFAHRLNDVCRGKDIVARYGGDEFVMVAVGLGSEADAERIARRIAERIVTVTGKPFDIDGHSCEVGVTVGYALAADDGTTAAELVKQADAAMYEGKLAGKRCVRRFEDKLPRAA